MGRTRKDYESHKPFSLSKKQENKHNFAQIEA